MAIFKKKWFRFILFAVLLIGTFASAFAVIFSVPEYQSGEIGSSLFFGAFAVVGQLFFFLAFDMLYDIGNGFLRFLRMAFIILGALICLAIGVTSNVLYSVSETSLSPWLRGFGGMWLAYGVICFYLYYFADCNFWPFALTPFIQIIAYAGAYAVTVVFAYVGGAAGAFFYGYPVLIACAVAFIIMCIILKKKGLPFDSDLSLPEITGKNKKPSPASIQTGGESVKTQRKDASIELFDPLEKAVKNAIVRALSGFGNGIYGRVTGDKIQQLVIANKVKVYGDVYYEWDSGSIVSETYHVTDDMQDLVDKLNDDIEEYIDDEVEALKDKYLNYDKFDEGDRKSEVKIRRVK